VAGGLPSGLAPGGRMGAGHQRCFAPRALQAEASTDHGGARRPVSQHPGGKDAEKRETTPPRATCVGYPARRPAEPSGSLPDRRPSRDPPRTPGSRRASSGPPPVAHRLRDLRRLVSVPASPAPGLRATLTVQPGVYGGQLEAPAAVAELDEQRNLYCRNTDSPVRDPRIAPLQPLPIAGMPRSRSPGAAAPATLAGSSSPTSRRIRATFASSAA